MQACMNALIFNQIFDYRPSQRYQKNEMLPIPKTLLTITQTQSPYPTRTHNKRNIKK